ncbi:hypothetical protein D1007_54152 [Hordeum vulgare]|nr:hypothetical protein D1007_54152 [Hordeum vulgare]
MLTPPKTTHDPPRRVFGAGSGANGHGILLSFGRNQMHVNSTMTLLMVMSMDGMCRDIDEDALRREVEREYMTMELDGTVLGVEDMANTALYVESDEARLNGMIGKDA